MKKVYFFFNSPYLGGAERSFCHQLKDVKEQCDYRLVIPYIFDKDKETKKLNELISLCGFDFEKVIYFPFHQGLFQFSRSAPLKGIFGLLQGIVQCLKSLQKINLQDGDLWWANGNKIGFILFLWAWISGFSQKFVWHFRDYPTKRGIFRHIWKLFFFWRPFKLVLVGNSHHVVESLETISSPKIKRFVVYNPVGEKIVPHVKSDKGSYILGAVAMFAPWKGLATIISMASLYEDQLRQIGVKSIHIYGGEIYQTKGAHQNHAQHLHNLNQKLSNGLIHFKGLRPPEEIYSEIDLLIHPSLREEPFGRVLVEAFAAQIPVLSTALGGAGEVLDEGFRGFLFEKYDYQGMVDLVNLALNDSQSSDVILNVYEFSSTLDSLVSTQMKAVLF